MILKACLAFVRAATTIGSARRSLPIIDGRGIRLSQLTNVPSRRNRSVGLELKGLIHLVRYFSVKNRQTR